MIFSGNLTETLKFYEVVEVQSKSGFKTTEERLYLTIKAERLKNRENYVVDANELYHSVELQFRMRYRKHVKETDIVEYEGERYRVISIDKYRMDDEIIIKIEKINE
jgi:SPP1 family predicted phage head-tail adaptor